MGHQVSATLQTSEIGLRLALGAQPKAILGMVLGRGLMLVLAETTIGLSAAALLTRYLASQLYGISATDPLSLIVVTVLLAAVSLFACYMPARRAMRVDPLVALRYE